MLRNLIIISRVLVFILNKRELYANPIEVAKPFQIFNASSFLAYEEFASKENQILKGNRNKRFLDDLIQLFSLLDDYYDDSEEEDEEEISGGMEIGNSQPSLCHNCNVTFNKIELVQHDHHEVASSNTSKSNNTLQSPEPGTENKAVTTSTEKVTSTEKADQLRDKIANKIAEETESKIPAATETPSSGALHGTEGKGEHEKGTTIETKEPVVASGSEEAASVAKEGEDGD